MPDHGSPRACRLLRLICQGRALSCYWCVVIQRCSNQKHSKALEERLLLRMDEGVARCL